MPGVLVLGCGGSSSNNNDAAKYDSGPIDGAVDRKADASPTPDGGADVAGDAIADAGPDRGIDGPVVDTGRADILADARQDVALDGRDAAADGRDTAGDVPITNDGPALEAGQGEAGASEVGVLEAPPLMMVATLSGAEVVPPVVTTATAVANVAVTADGTALIYHIMQTVPGATSVAIYLGSAGTNGSQWFSLTPVSPDMSGSVVLNPGQADSIESGMTYLLITSPNNPNGELRGQILLPGQSLWVANLTGGQEVPPVTTTASGQASFILSADQTLLRYHLTTSSGLTATGVRIDSGMAGTFGTTVHQLSSPSSTMDGVIVMGPADLQALAQKHLSINVTTTANPGGELRGQLLMPGDTLYTAMMSGSQESTPVNPSATGTAQFVLAPSGTSLAYEAVWSSLTGPATAAHIHTGAPGVSGPVLYPLTLNATGSGATGVLTVTSSDVVALNAGQIYVNAHTTANPAGEVRGQLGKP